MEETAGAMRTLLGGYQQTFLSAGLLCLIAAGMVIRIGKSSSTSAKPASTLAPAPDAAGIA